LLFCTDLGRPLNWRNVTREFKRFPRRADLPDIRFHDLRHSNGTILAAAGIPLKVIQERLGHSDPRTTLGFYGHATPPMGRDAARALQALLHEGQEQPSAAGAANYRGNYRGKAPPRSLGGALPCCFPSYSWVFRGALGRIRTHNPLVRSPGVVVSRWVAPCRLVPSAAGIAPQSAGVMPPRVAKCRPFSRPNPRPGRAPGESYQPCRHSVDRALLRCGHSPGRAPPAPRARDKQGDR
jgi:hypothetical protein